MSQKRSRRKVLATVGGVGVGLLAGCSGGGSGGGDGGDSQNIGIVYGAGGLGDQGFNDLAHEGIQRAEEELGISFDMVQPDDPTQFEQYQRRFAQSSSPSYDLVCTIGFTQVDALKTISDEFPEQDFMLIDEVLDRDNVASYTFKEHEGSYLVGTTAGQLTNRSFSAGAGSTEGDDTRIGFVGGVESFLINKFLAGYRAGAQAVDSDIEVLSSYVGSFSDPASAKESAKGMYSNGADLIFPAAGGSGVGVFQAAQEDSRLGFGVDTRKSLTQAEYADVILGSMIKKTNVAVFDSIESHVNGNFSGGENVQLGLQEDGVDFVVGDEIGSDIPEEVTAAVEENKQAIIDGDVDVPSEI